MLADPSALIKRSPSEVALGAGVFNRLLDDVFHLVPILGVDTLDICVKVFLNLVEHVPFFAVGDE